MKAHHPAEADPDDDVLRSVASLRQTTSEPGVKADTVILNIAIAALLKLVSPRLQRLAFLTVSAVVRGVAESLGPEAESEWVRRLLPLDLAVLPLPRPTRIPL